MPKYCIADYHVGSAATNRGDQAIDQAFREEMAARLAGDLEFYDLPWGRVLEGDTLRRINEADLLVFNGSGLYAYTPFPDISAVAVPCISLAIGCNRNLYGPDDRPVHFLSDVRADEIRRFHGKLARASVRDHATLTALESAGIGGACYCPDLALFLEAAKSPVTRFPGAVHLGLNLANHGGSTGRILQHILPVVVGVLKKWQSTRDTRIHYFMHESGESAVVHHLSSAGLDVRPLDLPPRQLVDAYGAMDLVLCEMMHACILCFNSSTPFVNIAYDVKNYAFMSDVGLSEFTLAGFSLNYENLQAKLERVFEQKDALRSSNIAKKETLRAINRSFVDNAVACLPRKR
jgi:hypothetical protein